MTTEAVDDLVNDRINVFRVGTLYSNEEIYRSLSVGNVGGIRAKVNPADEVERLVIFTSAPTARQLAENPYHDRLESGVLIYTGAGREGHQSVSGPNARIAQQQANGFAIYGFLQTASRRDSSVGAKRWMFLGLLEYLRCYGESQVDAKGARRNVWVFELRVHSEPELIGQSDDWSLMQQIMKTRSLQLSSDDREVVENKSNEAAPQTDEAWGEWGGRR